MTAAGAFSLLILCAALGHPIGMRGQKAFDFADEGLELGLNQLVLGQQFERMRADHLIDRQRDASEQGAQLGL